MSHHHEQQLPPPSDAQAFLACSAFEFGGECAHRGPGGVGGGITALKYPVKGLRSHSARPFERAVVRLTRESLSVYRPTDPGLHAELRWRSVRERRRHVSRRGDWVSYDFAFFTRSSILVLEVADAAAACGIVAALQLLHGPDASLAPRARDAEATASSARGRSPPALATRGHALRRGEQGGEALRRIRMREEEMREAIFHLPPRRSPAGSLRTEGWQPTRSPPSGSSSPAARPKSQLLPRHSAAAASAGTGHSPPPRSVSGSLAGAAARWSGAEATAEMRELLHLLEQEEKRANLSLRSQEERIRALRPVEKTRVPQQVTAAGGAPSSRNGQQQPRAQSHGEGGTDTMQAVGHGGHALPGRPPQALQETQPLSQADQPQELSPHQQRLSAESVGSADLNLKCEGRWEGAAANEASRMELRREAGQHEPQVSSGEPSLSRALAREQRDLALPQEREEAASPESQPLVSPPPASAAAAATSVAEAPQTTRVEDDGAAYGNWEELRHKSTGKVYYRHVVTKEVRWDAPPEVLELKREAGAPQQARQEVQEEAASVKKGSPTDLWGVEGVQGPKEWPPLLRQHRDQATHVEDERDALRRRVIY
ncbi:uncharacterized protein Tco025E_08298 [Trypanosoma conorhini]|uniref:WW domain-containing protein n=1 Tax=Trypanosoma conorhini TaxID=83891 RepID=A0A422NBQ1_9TRYP|nr:uncharacterized protein Tco025E_08298 [Trypanosoma conorhini]RNF02918.1 hypothetical protein Tco025E_08298 [Trypanosoma conorhini]